MFDLVSWSDYSRMLTLCAALVFPAHSAHAGDCPQPPDHSASIEALIEQVQQAEDETTASQIFSQLWEFWVDAPNEQAQAVLNRGMSRRSDLNLTGAIEDFNTLTEYCPTYAEGYNQRAFVHFLRRDYGAALADLDRALELSPRHVAAMSGRALSLFGLSRIEEARSALMAALELNPWLPERGLAAPGAPLGPVPSGDFEL